MKQRIIKRSYPDGTEYYVIQIKRIFFWEDRDSLGGNDSHATLEGAKKALWGFVNPVETVVWP